MDTRTKEQIKADRNERARLRMAKHRETAAYQEWLLASRERRRLLKEKYRRQAGAKTLAQKKADAESRRLKNKREQDQHKMERNQPDAHVLAWIATSKKQRRAMTKKDVRVTVDRLRELLTYQPETGILVWRVKYGNVDAGSVAGTLSSTGYLTVGIDGEKFRVHRVAWALWTGKWPVQTIDHMDGNRANNRAENLRCVSQSVNMQNIRKPTSRNTSGYLGVYWSERRGGWMAALSVDKKKKRWGPYSTSDRAHEKYLMKKRQLHEGCTI